MTPAEPDVNPHGSSRPPWLILIAMFGVILLVRLVALTADPPASLSWSAGIFSDEGIYAVDARSLIFTGHWSPGDFHSAIISPLFHLIQLAVFKCFGVGLLQVRLISVFFGVATLVMFYLALQCAFDERTAVIGTVFLGLSVPFVLYNRLALLEAPAVFVLVLAYLVWSKNGSKFLIGLILGLAFVVKPLALLAAPAFFCSAWPDRREFSALGVGLFAALLIYALVWYLPHQSTLARMNHYYAFHQYLPHTVRGLVHNLRRGFWTGEDDGILPYIVKHEPLLSFLAVFSLTRVRGANRDDRLLCAWLLAPICLFLFVSYTPSRYFVLFWPPLAALAARSVTTLKIPLGYSLVAVFAAVCLAQFFLLWQERTDTILENGKRLPQMVAGKTVVIGQFAPELCLSNRLTSVYIQPDLANDRNSERRIENAATLVTRSAYWDGWWRRTNAQIARSAPNRTFRLGRNFMEDIYSSR